MDRKKLVRYVLRDQVSDIRWSRMMIAEGENVEENKAHEAACIRRVRILWPRRHTARLNYYGYVARESV